MNQNTRPTADGAVVQCTPCSTCGELVAALKAAEKYIHRQQSYQRGFFKVCEQIRAALAKAGASE